MFSRNCLTILVTALILIVTVGCASSAQNFPTPIVTQQTQIPSTPSIVPTDTPLATNTITPIPDPFVSQCVDLGGIELPPPVETAKHWLLLREDQAPYPPHLLNLANGVTTPITDEDIIWMYVSPDRQEFAYDTFSRDNPDINKITIRQADGSIVKTIPQEHDWTFFWGWLDNDHLMVTQKAPEGEWVPSLIILDLSSGSQRELQSDYPNFDNATYLSWQFNRVIYDPTLTIAIYPSYATKSSTITFFDLVNEKVLTKFPAILAFTKQPEWSLDGQYLVVAETTADRGRDASGNAHYDQELILLDKSGNISRLTYFTDKYADVQIGNASWSPNGRHIAFWFTIGDSLQEQLAVLDLETRQVTNYCVTGFNLSIGNSPSPIWSPDSRLVLVNNRESQEASNKVIWVNIENGQGAVMDMGISIEGWLTSE